MDAGLLLLVGSIVAATAPPGFDAGLLIPVGSIVAALLAFGGVVVTALVRKPTEVGDLLGRMKTLEERNDAVGRDLQALRDTAFRRFGIMSRAVDALAQHIDRLTEAWPGPGSPPQMSATESAALDLARRAQNEAQQ